MLKRKEREREILKWKFEAKGESKINRGSRMAPKEV